MPFSIRIDPRSGEAVATCSGAIGPEEARDAVCGLWGAPGWGGTSAVWDFRQARFDITPGEARELAEFVIRQQPKQAPHKVAFVIASEVDFGMALMFGAFRRDPATDFRVFRDFEEAVAWARGPGGREA